MDSIIIFQQGVSFAIVYPTGELPIEQVARKDVPKGVPYLMLKKSDLPNDFVFSDAWEADFSNPDGYGIGSDAWFEEQVKKK